MNGPAVNLRWDSAAINNSNIFTRENRSFSTQPDYGSYPQPQLKSGAVAAPRVGFDRSTHSNNRTPLIEHSSNNR